MAAGVTCTTADLKPLYTKMEKAINELKGEFGAESSNLFYEINSGRSNYSYIINTGSYLCMSNFLLFLRSDTKPHQNQMCNPGVTTNVVNCVDCAALLKTFTNIIGGNLQCGRLTVPALPTASVFSLNPIAPIGSSQFSAFNLGNFGYFGFHMVTTSETTFDDSSKVYDSCLKLGVPDPTKYALGFNATTSNSKLSDGLTFFDTTNLTIGTMVTKVTSGSNGTCVIARATSAANDGISASYVVEMTSNTEYILKRNETTVTVTVTIPGTPPTTRTTNLTGHVGVVTTIDGLEILVINGINQFAAGDKFEFTTTYSYDFYKPSLTVPGSLGRGNCIWGTSSTFNVE
jgi:hypothetical protein